MGQYAGIISIVLMFAIFYFLLIRPQQKQQKAVKEMQRALQKGDRIVTIGGLQGVIDAIDEDTVVLDCNGNKLTYTRVAIREIVKE